MVADALSRRHSLLRVLSSRVLGFELVKEYYKEDEKLREVLEACSKGSHGAYVIHGGFIFRRERLSIPSCSIRELLVREAHGGGLAGHFGMNKTLAIL